MATPKLTAERLRHVLDYNPGTGLFRWKVRTSNRVSVGDIAGAPHKAGYVQIYVDGENFLAHRLAWLHVVGAWPAYTIDHINHNRSDNRFANLRDVPQAINAQNMHLPFRSNRTSGVLGVSWSRKDRVWTAQISVGNRTRRIGAFRSIEEAQAAYLAAKRELHPGMV